MTNYTSFVPISLYFLRKPVILLRDKRGGTEVKSGRSWRIKCVGIGLSRISNVTLFRLVTWTQNTIGGVSVFTRNILGTLNDYTVSSKVFLRKLIKFTLDQIQKFLYLIFWSSVSVDVYTCLFLLPTPVDSRLTWEKNPKFQKNGQIRQILNIRLVNTSNTDEAEPVSENHKVWFSRRLLSKKIDNKRRWNHDTRLNLSWR